MKYTVVMQSCKKFSAICTTMLQSLLPYDFIDEIILATDDEKMDKNVHPKLKLVLLDQDYGFSSNMIHSLEKCENDKAIILLDDYVLPSPSYQPVNTKSLVSDAGKLLDERKDVGCVRFNIFDPSCADFSDVIGSFVKVKDKFAYICSLQPSLWRVACLKKILRHGEDAWVAETSGSKRMRDLNIHAYISTSESMAHVNALRFGKYIRNKFVDYADSHGLKVPGNMDVFVKLPSKDKKKSETKVVNLNKYRSGKKKK